MKNCVIFWHTVKSVCVSFSDAEETDANAKSAKPAPEKINKSNKPKKPGKEKKPYSKRESQDVRQMTDDIMTSENFV